MERFVNSSIERYHHQVISEFSDTARPLYSGVSRGFSLNRYSWVADYLFKHTGNIFTNPHTCYLSFFDDKEIMYQEYANVSRIYSNYKFLQYYARQRLSSHSFELSNKQYSMIGQRYAEFDIVEYINASNLIVQISELKNPLAPIAEQEDQDTSFRVNHLYYKAPIYHQSGYMLDHEDIPADDTYRRQYLWVSLYFSAHSMKQGEYDFDLTVSEWLGDLYLNEAYTVIDDFQTLAPNSYIRRLIDYKMHVDNPRYVYFPEPEVQWVVYHRDTTHYTQEYMPYLGFIMPYHNSGYEIPRGNGDDFEAFTSYPEIVDRGNLEPAKTILDWTHTGSGPLVSGNTGYACYNPANHLGEGDDQSRTMYRICEHMIVDDNYVGMKDGNNFIWRGIDAETERNRRYSAVVTTEPYFVTKPILSGQVAHVSFVDYQGNFKNHNGSEANFVANPNTYLKIKAPAAMIAEIDRLLSLKEMNPDIIDTLTMNSPTSNLSPILNDVGDPYTVFGGTATNFYKRQNYALDDLHAGHPTLGLSGDPGVNHWLFQMEYGISKNSDKYSEGKMNVNGMGFISRTNKVGDIVSPMNSVNFYCSNYKPARIPLISVGVPDSDTPAHWVDPKEPTQDLLLFPGSNINSQVTSELFRPMIKHPEINGFIKIMERNPHFETVRSADGDIEVIYNIEIPYCPGSYTVRVNLNSSDPWLPTQVLYKESYIPAGSHAIDNLVKYDSHNARHTPTGKHAFTRHTVFQQTLGSGKYVYTDPKRLGGKYSKMRASTKDKIRYPKNIVFDVSQAYLLSLMQHKQIGYQNLGTYEVKLEDKKDTRLLFLTDNRQWKFDEDRYSSYIGRENPSYVCEVDIKTLLEDYTIYLRDHNSIPDSKRWLSAYMNGFAHLSTPEDPYYGLDAAISPQDVVPIGMTEQRLLSQESDSDMIIEVWDNSGSNTETTIVDDFVAVKGSDGNDSLTDPGTIIGGDFVFEFGLRFGPVPIGNTSCSIFFRADPAGTPFFNTDFRMSWWDGLARFVWYGLQITYPVPYQPYGLLRMRLTRTGTDLTFEINHGTGWIVAGTDTWYDTEKNFYLDVDGADHHGVSYFYFQADYGFLPTGEYPDDNPPSKATYIYDDFDNGAFDPFWQSGFKSWNILEYPIETTETYKANWKPFTPIGFNTQKVPGTLVLDEMNMDYLASPSKVVALDLAPDDKSIYYIYLNRFDVSSGEYTFPSTFDLYSLDGATNKVLYDSSTGKSYHIVYIKVVGAVSPPRYLYKVYLRMEDTDVLPPFIPTEPGKLRILESSLQMSKSTSFEVETSEASDNSPLGVIARYIDIKKRTTDIDQIDRYVNSQGKIFFRLRVHRNRRFPESHDSEDVTTMQYIGEDITLPSPDIWINYPWSDDGVVFDPGFDWSKIDLLEEVRKFGLTYFRCLSK